MLVDNIKFKEILEKHRLRVTTQREALYQSLAGHNQPVSLKRLASSLSDHMDQVTVYRNLDLFENIGVVNKVYTGWKYRIELSEQFRPHHHHMTCTSCGDITTISLGNRMEKAMESFGEKHGFTITDHQIELSGLCKNCN